MRKMCAHHLELHGNAMDFKWVPIAYVGVRWAAVLSEGFFIVFRNIPCLVPGVVEKVIHGCLCKCIALVCNGQEQTTCNTVRIGRVDSRKGQFSKSISQSNEVSSEAISLRFCAQMESSSQL